MNIKNTITQANKKPTFSMVINSQTMQKMISNTINEPRRAARFTSALISAVSANTKLAECRPESIISAALKGEELDLSLGLGQYFIVPYGDSANFQISYKGFAHLAQNTKQYESFDVLDVREGEYKGKDPRTRKPVIKWIEDDAVREKTPLVGFYGYYNLIGGFSRAIYWTHEKILDHADKYSKAFKKNVYEDLCSGKITGSEADRLRAGSPWYADPLSEPHMKMCRKTLLIQLLNDGVAPLSVEMQTAFKLDGLQEKGDEIIYADDSRIVNASTGEIVADVPATEKPVAETPAAPEPVTVETPAKKSAATKKAESQMNMFEAGA